MEKRLWKVAKEHGLEGIVCKNLNSTYNINGKNDIWRKVKNYQDLIAVIAGVTYRAGIVNSVLLGLYDGEGNFGILGIVVQENYRPMIGRNLQLNRTS